ncbi:putative ABC transporter permease [Bifidobacterium stellenboschense]|uniref:Putative membrane protein n=1 Tax=Bifidobacterium stellenboschense TaxID=762211 RepID=A0A087D8P2_9BIFI|nr:putative ABC transporter permease [Bifidobacterium stellenboschense]KFI91892.1 putative membrane protein [Bifidobacterium stellenboschense]
MGKLSDESTPAGEEAAVAADLVAAELDEQSRLDAQRLPWLIRMYGVIVLLDGLVTLPIVVFASIAAVRAIMRGELTFHAASLTAILTGMQALVLIADAAALIVFGVLLLRNRRRYAARWAYVLMPVTLAEGMLSLALDGLGVNLIAPAVGMAILVAVSIACDPGLAEERRLQRALKRMDDRDAYDAAVRAGMLGRDPSGKGYIALDFFNIFWLFTVACVFGLAIETVYHFAMYHGELQDRAGLLWGPFSPIYGCGAVLVTVALNRLWKSNPFLIFCASAVIGGTFEYATSWFMEVAFGITAWDYTGQWLSIDGRTSGKYMVFWGLIGVVWVRWILPRLLALINRIPWKVRYSLTAVCAVLMLVDIVFTLMALDCWYGRMAGLPQDSPITQWFATHYGDAYMANRFQTMTIDPSKAGRV